MSIYGGMNNEKKIRDNCRRNSGRNVTGNKRDKPVPVKADTGQDQGRNR